MELKAIEQLLEKYLEGETSLQEEAQLRAYFCSNKVAPHLQEYAPIFAYFSVSREEAISPNRMQVFENSLVESGDKDGFRSARSDKGDLFSLSNAARVERNQVYSWVAVAASIVIMAGVFLQKSPDVNEFGSYEDPEIAMEETKKALDMVSELMHSGNENLGYLREFENTKNKILK